MGLEQGYCTVGKEAEDEFVERRSRFIGYCRPVQTEQEALDFIESIRKRHWDATHNVYAYVLRQGGICRYSDDGEPQGTAGVPVLDVLRKENIVDCVVVVTRYFGGILLGGGGLVRAYSHAARLGVDAAERVNMRLCIRGRICCSYAQYGRVQALVAAHGGRVEDTVFTQEVTVLFYLPAEDVGGLQQALTDYSADTILVEELEKIFLPIIKNGQNDER